MTLKDFITAFITKLNDNNIKHCILRNYEHLPDKNIGNDIDFLIERKWVSDTIKILSTISNYAFITGIIDRNYVISIFIFGVEHGNEKSIQVDLFTTLSWKNLPYISSNDVLKSSLNNGLKTGIISHPSASHEAIISLFSSYLVGGWIKDRYQEKVISIFKREPTEIISALTPTLGEKLSKALISSINNDDRVFLYRILPKIRRNILFHYLSNNPIKTIVTVADYYRLELKIRFTSYPITSIVFLGPDGSGKSSVIDGVIPSLKNSTKIISLNHLKPTLNKRSNTKGMIATDPHALPPRSALLSSLKLGYWLLLYWYDLYFDGHKNLTLKIWDRYCYDVLVDPKRYRYGGSMTFARWIAKLAPKPALVILLDAPAEILYARKQEVPFAETARQREAYLALVNAMDNGVVIDATQPLDKVIQDTCSSIVERLANRVKQRHGL